MNIEEFRTRFGSDARSIKQVMQQWQVDELDTLLRTLRNQHDQLVGAAVIAGDAMHGDGLRDQISDELGDAVRSLKTHIETVEGVRDYLLDSSKNVDGIDGLVNWIKGRIGEIAFKNKLGSTAELAPSQIQKGWDVSDLRPSVSADYVQVKTVSDPGRAVREMKNLQEQVHSGSVGDLDGEPLEHVKFTVPEDIAEEVRRRVEDDPELLAMLHEQTIPISASDAAGIVEKGLNNVGPGELAHFLKELSCDTLVAGSLHGLVNGLLWYKGAKGGSDAVVDSATSTMLTTTGAGAGLVAEKVIEKLVTETLVNTVMFSSVVGISSRILLGRLARSRWSFAEYLEKSITVTNVQIAALQP